MTVPPSAPRRNQCADLSDAAFRLHVNGQAGGVAQHDGRVRARRRRRGNRRRLAGRVIDVPPGRSPATVHRPATVGCRGRSASARVIG